MSGGPTKKEHLRCKHRRSMDGETFHLTQAEIRLQRGCRERFLVVQSSFLSEGPEFMQNALRPFMIWCVLLQTH